MDKQELAERLARRSRQTRGKTADKLDDLIYKLWKKSREGKLSNEQSNPGILSPVPVKRRDR